MQNPKPQFKIKKFLKIINCRAIAHCSHTAKSASLRSNDKERSDWFVATGLKNYPPAMTSSGEVGRGKLKSNNKGFIALIIVLIILGVTLLIGLGISQLSISEAQMSLQKSQSSQAYYLTNLCAEETLMELKEDSGYTGETINIENGNCTSSVSSVEGAWTVEISADFSNQIKKMKIVISQIDPEMIIDSWQEVADF